MSRYLVLGRIVAPHGVRGAVRVESHMDPPEALLRHRRWLLREPDGALRPVEVRPIAGRQPESRRGGSGSGGRMLRAQLAGVATREAAEGLRGREILLERSELPPAGAREYFREDLVGLTVRNGEGRVLGQLTHFLDAPAGTLMVVRGEREQWLPASAPCLRRVDLERGEIEVDWPEEP